MLVSTFNNKKIFLIKPQKKGEDKLQKLGKVHFPLCYPGGRKLAGFLVKRPDVVGMVKREDIFVAFDALEIRDDLLCVKDIPAATGDAAIKRLKLEWDICILWTGMDAKTRSGKDLGFIGDLNVNWKTGEVESFHVGDGSVAQSLVGHLDIPTSYLLGYDKGFMIVKDEVLQLKLSGGAAGIAGEQYAKAKEEGKKIAAKVDDAGAKALDQGSKDLGKQLGKTKGMFGAFMDEYKKASKE